MHTIPPEILAELRRLARAKRIADKAAAHARARNTDAAQRHAAKRLAR
jgi:hypothetical protein